MAEPSRGPSASEDFHLTRGKEMAIIWPPTLVVTARGDQRDGTSQPILTSPSHRPPRGPLVGHERPASAASPLSDLRHPGESPCAHSAAPRRNRHWQGAH